MTQKQLDKLAKKYNVLDWFFSPSHIFQTPDNKIWVMQTYRDIESLFKAGENNIVCIYDLTSRKIFVKNKYINQVRGTVISKEYLEAIKLPLSN